MHRPSIGFTVEDPEFDGSRNGNCMHSQHRIRVETRNAPAQRVKTLVHEIAHALLHETFESRALAELEAESTAYVVRQALGINSSDYAFEYVTVWAGGGDHLGRVRARSRGGGGGVSRISRAREAPG